MNLPGFDVGVFLGYLEVLGVAVCASFERHDGRNHKKSPLVILSFTLRVRFSYLVRRQT